MAAKELQPRTLLEQGERKDRGVNFEGVLKRSVCNFRIFFHSLFQGLVASHIPIGPLSIGVHFPKTKCPIVTH